MAHLLFRRTCLGPGAGSICLLQENIVSVACARPTFAPCSVAPSLPLKVTFKCESCHAPRLVVELVIWALLVALVNGAVSTTCPCSTRACLEFAFANEVAATSPASNKSAHSASGNGNLIICDGHSHSPIEFKCSTLFFDAISREYR